LRTGAAHQPGKGKPISDAYGIELRAVVNTLRYYGSLVGRPAGEIPQAGADALALVTREPIGVVAAIVP
jgi:gamma-glutamyl-gamma-aminobutyraldehyde dehydrogenase